MFVKQDKNSSLVHILFSSNDKYTLGLTFLKKSQILDFLKAVKQYISENGGFLFRLFEYCNHYNYDL